MAFPSFLLNDFEPGLFFRVMLLKFYYMELLVEGVIMMEVMMILELEEIIVKHCYLVLH